MPFGTCTRCDHFFALDTERAPQTHCPRCEQPLRILPREEALAALRRIHSRQPIRTDSSCPAAQSPPDAEPKELPPIPPTEMAILAGTIVEVVKLAIHQDRDEGCTCLISALCYAEQSRVAGEPWGEPLVRRYRDLLETYSVRYSVCFE